VWPVLIKNERKANYHDSTVGLSVLTHLRAVFAGCI
jgi:hypothetical protein